MGIVVSLPSNWWPKDAGTVSGAPIGKTNGAGGIGDAVFRRRGEAYRGNSFPNNKAASTARSPVPLPPLQSPVSARNDLGFV
jgi:hypothetical protein